MVEKRLESFNRKKGASNPEMRNTNFLSKISLCSNENDKK